MGNGNSYHVWEKALCMWVWPWHPFDESFDFIRRYQRSTIPDERYVFKLAHKNTIKNVSSIEGISEGTCQRIYNHYAKEYLELINSEPINFLDIGDIVTRKGTITIQSSITKKLVR